MASSYAITTEKQRTRYFNNAACYADLFRFIEVDVKENKDKITNVNVKCVNLKDEQVHLLVILFKVFKNFKGTAGIVENSCVDSVCYSKSINLSFENQDWNSIVFILFTLRLLDEYQPNFKIFREVIQALPFFKPREAVWFLLLLQYKIPNKDDENVVSSLKVHCKSLWMTYNLEFISYKFRNGTCGHYLGSFKHLNVSLNAVNQLFRNESFNGFYSSSGRSVFKTFQEDFMENVRIGHSDFFSESNKFIKEEPHYNLKHTHVILPRIKDNGVGFHEVKEQFKIQCPQVFNYKKVRTQGYLSQPIITP